MTDSRPNTGRAAYGGPGWQPRTQGLQQELGRLWAPCGANSEWGRLKAVLLHRPGTELEKIKNPDQANFLESPDLPAAQAQHDALVDAYQVNSVRVHFVDSPDRQFPNLMFQADLLFMTPEGAILARPASDIRAGEERWAAHRLAEIGIPILMAVHGQGTFEGADALWLRPKIVLLATGLRTNPAGADQVEMVLRSLDVRVIRTHLPRGAMHLMGALRLVSANTAVAWRARLPPIVEEHLSALGIRTHYLPDDDEARDGHALNFVTLSPNHVLAPAGNPATEAFLESLGVSCSTVAVDELTKAAGAIGCLTGVLERQLLDP